MPFVTTNDDCRLHWVEKGKGRPILLIHGYISDIERNWRGPGWLDALSGAGYRAIAYDQRGHGKSDKRYDPAEYASDRLVEDACTVLDAASVGQAVLMGYSMGARIALEIGLTRPARCTALILGGMGNAFPDLGGPEIDREAVALALEAEESAEVPDLALGYRAFGKRVGADMRAMAAYFRRERRSVTAAELTRVPFPTLVIVGDQDGVAGDGEPLARALPRATLIQVPGKDHMKTVGAKETIASILAFLSDLQY